MVPKRFSLTISGLLVPEVGLVYRITRMMQRILGPLCTTVNLKRKDGLCYQYQLSRVLKFYVVNEQDLDRHNWLHFVPGKILMMTMTTMIKHMSLRAVTHMARHVRAAPECNAKIQPLIDFCCFQSAMFRPYIVL